MSSRKFLVNGLAINLPPGDMTAAEIQEAINAQLPPNLVGAFQVVTPELDAKRKKIQADAQANAKIEQKKIALHRAKCSQLRRELEDTIALAAGRAGKFLFNGLTAEEAQILIDGLDELDRKWTEDWRDE